MTSKICISNIIHCTVKQASEIPASRLTDGRLPAGAVINRIQPGQTIDVIDLMRSPLLICDTSIELNECDIRPGKRLTYKYSDISDNSFNTQRLAVGTEFFKGMEQTDTIYLILH